MGAATVGIVVIGRNEGERLIRCLKSLPPRAHVVYIDSGSADGSLNRAQDMGFSAVLLSDDRPFSAARARNEGALFFQTKGEMPDFIQMIDGDCELNPSWIDAALGAMRAEPALAAVFGRLRERHPGASLYNALCDDEWNGPVGRVDACGGIALFRSTSFAHAGGFNEQLIAGEEPDLCLRMRQQNGIIRRIESEMALHDAAMTHFSQWWVRTRRSGFAYTEHVLLHRGKAIPAWTRAVFSIFLWAGGLPLIILMLSMGAVYCSQFLFGAAALLLFGLYPLQWFRIMQRKRREGASASFSRAYAGFMIIAKFPQLGGALRALFRHVTKAKAQLIEYKRARPAA